MTKPNAGLITPLPVSDSGSTAVWGSKRINSRPQSCFCLTWSGYLLNDDDNLFYYIMYLCLFSKALRKQANLFFILLLEFSKKIGVFPNQGKTSEFGEKSWRFCNYYEYVSNYGNFYIVFLFVFGEKKTTKSATRRLKECQITALQILNGQNQTN